MVLFLVPSMLFYSCNSLWYMCVGDWKPKRFNKNNLYFLFDTVLPMLVGGWATLWKIWVRQLGWLEIPNISGKMPKMATKPPTRMCWLYGYRQPWPINLFSASFSWSLIPCCTATNRAVQDFGPSTILKYLFVASYLDSITTLVKFIPHFVAFKRLNTAENLQWALFFRGMIRF